MDIFSVLEALPLRLWRTRKGRLIPIRDLDYTHLRNIIAMLERRYPGIDEAEVYEFYLHGPPPNGEMAQMLYEQELDAIGERVSFQALAASRAYHALINERNRRDSGEHEPVVRRAKEWAADRLASAQARLRVGVRDVVLGAPVRTELAARQLAARALAFGRRLAQDRRRTHSRDFHEGGIE